MSVHTPSVVGRIVSGKSNDASSGLRMASDRVCSIVKSIGNLDAGVSDLDTLNPQCLLLLPKKTLWRKFPKWDSVVGVPCLTYGLKC